MCKQVYADFLDNHTMRRHIDSKNYQQVVVVMSQDGKTHSTTASATNLTTIQLSSVTKVKARTLTTVKLAMTQSTSSHSSIRLRRLAAVSTKSANTAAANTLENECRICPGFERHSRTHSLGHLSHLPVEKSYDVWFV